MNISTALVLWSKKPKPDVRFSNLSTVHTFFCFSSPWRYWDYFAYIQLESEAMYTYYSLSSLLQSWSQLSRNKEMLLLRVTSDLFIVCCLVVKFWFRYSVGAFGIQCLSQVLWFKSFGMFLKSAFALSSVLCAKSHCFLCQSCWLFPRHREHRY